MKNGTFVLLLMLGMTAILPIGCAPSAEGIRISGAWVRASPSLEQASAAYLVIQNATGESDKLIAVHCDAAGVAELHETTEASGMMHMSPLDAIVVPAEATVELKPGGMHIMLLDLTRELTPGDEVTLTLSFARAGNLTVTADVRDE